MNPFLTLTTVKPKLTVRCLFGDDDVKLTDGFGGWQIVERPRRVSLTQWQGRSPLTQQIPVRLDAWGARSGSASGSIEMDCSKLERMALPPSEGLDPPLVRISGAAALHTDLDWVISALEWGATIRRASDGQRTRQDAVLTLISFTGDGRILEKSALAAAQGGSSSGSAGGGNIYIVKAGDTLQSIAARQLGNWKRYTDIAKLNNIRDPNKIKTGQKLRMPSV